MTGLVLLGALWVLFTLLQRTTLADRISNDGLAIFAASMAMSSTVLFALLCLLMWRVSADQRALAAGVALGFYGLLAVGGGVLLPRLLGIDISSRLTPGFVLAGMPALVLFGAAATRPEIDAERGWRETVAPIAAATTWGAFIIVTVSILMPGFGGRPAELSGAGALSWAAVATMHGWVAYRTGSHLLHWTAVVSTGMGVALVLGSSGATFAVTASMLLIATSMGIGLFGVAVTLYRCHAGQQRRTFDALVEATLATTRAQAVSTARAEHRHEAHAALLGIEAAAQGISHHRDVLTDDQFAALSEAMVAEVHRLHGLIDDGNRDVTAPEATFDLLDVVMPVVSCHRAAGLDVHVEIPCRTRIRGSPVDTAQVVAGLLANARRHAPGSPVTLLVDAEYHNAVVLRVEDRGPGVPDADRERIFERGVSTHRDGSGIGLFVARRLMQRQGGSISVAARSGGGAMFDLRFGRGHDSLAADGSA
ncbi:MAG: sensor histidine kinase [Acidimicrobiia bacterium]